MLHINELTYRIEGRLVIDAATAAIPAGHKVGLVGRNGTGKTTLLKLVTGDLAPDDGSAFGCEMPGDGGADSSRRSGDDRHSPRKVQAHVASRSW